MSPGVAALPSTEAVPGVARGVSSKVTVRLAVAVPRRAAESPGFVASGAGPLPGGEVESDGVPAVAVGSPGAVVPRDRSGSRPAAGRIDAPGVRYRMTPCMVPTGAAGLTEWPRGEPKVMSRQDARPSRYGRPEATRTSTRRSTGMIGATSRHPPPQDGFVHCGLSAARRRRNLSSMPIGHPPSFSRVLIRAISRTQRCRSWCSISRISSRGQWKWYATYAISSCNRSAT
jgi:hypothetical protein